MPTSLNAILVSIVVPSLLELSQSLASNLIIQISVCIKIVGNPGVEAIFSEADPSPKISRAKALVRFSRYRSAQKRLWKKLDLKGRKWGAGWRRRTTSTRTNLWLRPPCEAGSSEICPISANLSAK
jgi:hypothetical protein